MSTTILAATEFKATCREVFDRPAARQLERVEVTKRGKVVAVLTPPECPSASLEGQPRSLGAFWAGLDPGRPHD